ncbi:MULTISPECIES: MFS transporter [Paraburkholderia]|jgi:ACS family D-galactonate transporter-like MFS transporter|uniref:MFS transporter n=1 Tax=Paraburkholderia madseniana TaxID=2599607 RepID=A0A6N6WB52_9BURK|nr:MULTISPECIES: MFS transporter [Paraburkholderia]KAE8756964.1 MFS transporter [Paraburkholderia madseniana]MCX4176173.1 MFS transporter [Paraburkholderia madseniana]MDQ6464167.1 MFS transporter [Paraburkholderia madseniana]NPT70794.1 MFS transporter [Paraburkholderia madseniana]
MKAVEEQTLPGRNLVYADTAKRSRVRYVVLSMLLAATILNYVDRSALGIVAPGLSKGLALDKMEMGELFAGFGLAYSIALVPGGMLTDILGSRLAYGLSLLGWSFATLTQGFANGYQMLLGSRLAIGAMEAPAFPSNARSVTLWFPARERGFATSVYVMGQYIGTPLFTGLLLWISAAYGWRAVFFVTGGVGILFSLLWYGVYRDPHQHTGVNAAELQYINEGATAARKPREKFDWRMALKLLGYRQILAICIGKFCNNTLLVFFTTWFMTYLIEARHMSMIKVGIFQALPFIGATVGILLAGFLSDFFIRRGVSISTARKAPLIIGTLLGASIVLVNFVESNEGVIAILTMAFFAQGVGSMSWAAVSEIAPRQYVGLTSSITSLAANIAAVTTPLMIGYITHHTGHFYWALNLMGAICLLGALSYSVLLGKLSRIEL